MKPIWNASPAFPDFPDPDPGWYNLDGPTYHQGPGLSKSMMGPLAQSPAHLKAYLATPQEWTPAFVFGDAFHAYILEPERFQREFAVLPDGIDMRAKDGKAWAASQGDKNILKPADMDSIKGMRDSLVTHPAASALLFGAVEISGYFRDPVSGCLGKLRPDVISEILGMTLVDLKTARDASMSAFTKDAYNFGYHLQAAWNLYGASQIEGEEIKHFAFVVVEKEAPFAVNVWRAGPDFVQAGQVECMKLAQVYKECFKKDWWPCTEPQYSPEIRDLDLPRWAKRKKSEVIYEAGGGLF